MYLCFMNLSYTLHVNTNAMSSNTYMYEILEKMTGTWSSAGYCNKKQCPMDTVVNASVPAEAGNIVILSKKIIKHWIAPHIRGIL